MVGPIHLLNNWGMVSIITSSCYGLRPHSFSKVWQLSIKLGCTLHHVLKDLKYTNKKQKVRDHVLFQIQPVIALDGATHPPHPDNNTTYRSQRSVKIEVWKAIGDLGKTPHP